MLIYFDTFQFHTQNKIIFTLVYRKINTLYNSTTSLSTILITFWASKSTLWLKCDSITTNTKLQIMTWCIFSTVIYKFIREYQIHLGCLENPFLEKFQLLSNWYHSFVKKNEYEKVNFLIYTCWQDKCNFWHLQFVI